MLRTRRLITLLIGTAMLMVGSVVMAGSASAEPCEITRDDGSVYIGDCDESHEIIDGDNEDAAVACEIEPGDNACWNGESCLINDPSTIPLEAVPDGALPEQPDEDSHHAFRLCDSGYVWYWSQDDGPSVEELATEAYNSLPFPQITPTFNPPTRTIVNLPTWWWAAGASQDELSASAGSVTVRATPSRLQVDPGDGSATLNCDFVTEQSDACSYTYRRAKASGYDARMRLTWTLEFTDGGDVITVAGIPTDFTTQWSAVTVPVNEIQTRVTRVR